MSGLASSGSSAKAATVCDPESTVRFRVLPEGEFREASVLGWKGHVLKLDLQGWDSPTLGAPLEIESGYMLYLGELCQRDGPVGSVRVEHALDRASLAADRDHWG